MRQLQADLIGTAKEGERDDRVRARLHAAWLQEQDRDEMAKVVAGVRRGWQRPNAANGLHDDDEVCTAISSRRLSVATWCLARRSPAHRKFHPCRDEHLPTTRLAAIAPAC